MKDRQLVYFDYSTGKRTLEKPNHKDFKVENYTLLETEEVVRRLRKDPRGRTTKDKDYVLYSVGPNVLMLVDDDGNLMQPALKPHSGYWSSPYKPTGFISKYNIKIDPELGPNEIRLGGRTTGKTLKFDCGGFLDSVRFGSALYDTNTTNTWEKEQMNIKKTTLIDGRDVDDFSAEELISVIQKEQAAVRRYDEIDFHSSYVQNKIEEHEANIEKLIKLLDKKE